MKNTFDDFEQKVKSLNEDEIEFPINLGDIQGVAQQAIQMAQPEAEVVEVEAKPEKEKDEEPCHKGSDDCPFKKAMEMLDFAKAGVLKLKNTPKPEINPGQPLDENNEYNRIRRGINASLDFVRTIL